MKLPIKQILKGEVVCSFGWFFRKAASLLEHAPANVLYTPCLGGGGRATAPARAPTPPCPTCRLFPRCPRLRDRPRARGAPRGPAFIDWGGGGAGPLQGATVVRANWGAGAAQSAQPAGSAFSEALAFPRNHFCTSQGPFEPLFSLYSGGGGGGGCPKDGRGPGRLVMLVSSSGCRSGLGRPCPEDVSPALAGVSEQRPVPELRAGRQPLAARPPG